MSPDADVIARMRRHVGDVDVQYTALDCDGNYAHVGTKGKPAHLSVAGEMSDVAATIVEG